MIGSQSKDLFTWKAYITRNIGMKLMSLSVLGPLCLLV